MNKLLVITAIMTLALSACVVKEPEKEQLSLMEVSKQELAAALEERDQLLSLVTEISTSMEQIKTLETVMTVSGTQSSEKPEQRYKILNDINAMKKMLRQRRERLADLESRLEQSTLYTDELKAAVAALKGQIDMQTRDIDGLREQLTTAYSRIDSLNHEVDSLNNTVTEVTETLDAAEATSARLEEELNTCYYVVASKSQLKEHQIIETGFLRKSQLMKGDFDKDFFVAGDKRSLHNIETHSNKVKIHTNHPVDSYVITNQNGEKVLKILLPDKFWSLTNYLVLQID